MNTSESIRRRLSDLLGDSPAAVVPVYGVVVDGVAPAARGVDRIRCAIDGLPRPFIRELAAVGARVEVVPGGCVGWHPLVKNYASRAAMGLAKPSLMVAIVPSDGLNPEGTALHEIAHLLDFAPTRRGEDSYANRTAWGRAHAALNRVWGEMFEGMRDCPHEGFAEAFSRCFAPPPDWNSLACPAGPPAAALEYFRQLEREIA